MIFISSEKAYANLKMFPLHEIAEILHPRGLRRVFASGGWAIV